MQKRMKNIEPEKEDVSYIWYRNLFWKNDQNKKESLFEMLNMIFFKICINFGTDLIRVGQFPVKEYISLMILVVIYRAWLTRNSIKYVLAFSLCLAYWIWRVSNDSRSSFFYSACSFKLGTNLLTVFCGLHELAPCFTR